MIRTSLLITLSFATAAPAQHEGAATSRKSAPQAATAKPTAPQHKNTSTARLPGGKVQIHYTSTTLRGRGLGDLKKNQVWRMSAGPAAELWTTIPLRHERTILAPGRYRLSAKYLGNERFRLLVFRGPIVFTDGTPVQELPLTLGNEKRNRDRLAIGVWAGEDDGVRGKLVWGKHSLNFSFQPVAAQRIPMTLDGHPATLHVFALPRSEKLVDSVKNRVSLFFASLQQEGGARVRYDFFGVNKARRGATRFEITCRNTAVSELRLQRDFYESMVEQAEKAVGAPERLAFMKRGLKLAKQRLDAVDRHPRKIVLKAQIQFQREPDLLLRAHLLSKVKEGERPSRVEMAIGYGLRRAKVTLDLKQFKAEDDDD